MGVMDMLTARNSKMTENIAIGLVRNQQGLYCVGQRRVGVHLGSCWEFPGGKCCVGESPWLALRRELQEELGIVTQRAIEIMTIPYDYPSVSVCLHVFRVDAYDGQPQAMEAQPLRWVSPQQLQQLTMPAANQAIVAQLAVASQ